MNTLEIEKIAARNAIKVMINGVQKEIDDARDSKAELNKINTEISNLLEDWASKLQVFEASEMASVVVKDKFEGESADKISVRLPEPIAEMENTKATACTVQSEIAEQVSKLNIYISELQEKKAALYAQLAAI